MFSRSLCSLFFLLAYTVLSVFGSSSKQCLTPAEAEEFVANFTIIAAEHSGYVQVAKDTLTSDFMSISDSVNFVDQIPLNTTMTHFRAELLKQEAKLPATGKVTSLFVGHTCDTITWYFEFATTPLPTRGIAILFVNEDKKIYKSYREVNSGAVLYNLKRPECESNFTVSIGSAGPTPTEASCSCS